MVDGGVKNSSRGGVTSLCTPVVSQEGAACAPAGRLSPSPAKDGAARHGEASTCCPRFRVVLPVSVARKRHYGCANVNHGWNKVQHVFLSQFRLFTPTAASVVTLGPPIKHDIIQCCQYLKTAGQRASSNSHNMSCNN